ncbi:Zn(II)2Cys6 transcription factor [Aspergillus luchuensis]|uniref:Zn(II)2Cys6 transcription factor n=1 Tax=Aspergillus kawachii TaxID=1069201 RepID=A0A146FZI5_ASPKA|nr:Zn(II)2Cys6 transcription factor [Aspergillus luchuensis]
MQAIFVPGVVAADWCPAMFCNLTGVRRVPPIGGYRAPTASSGANPPLELPAKHHLAESIQATVTNGIDPSGSTV